MSSNDSQTSGTDFDLLKNLRDIILIATILLYYMGWLYIYFYYDTFGIPIRMLGLDFYTYIIYSSNIFLDLSRQCTALLFIPVIVFVVVLLRIIPPKTLKKGANYCLFLLFPALFFVSRNIGIADAKAAIAKPDDHLRRAEIIFNDKAFIHAGPKDETSEITTEQKLQRLSVLKYNHNTLFRLLSSNSDEYIFYAEEPAASASEKESSVKNVYIIKKEFVDYLILKK